METLDVFLPMLLYMFGIILLIVLIVLGLKLIQMLNKVDRLVDNIEQKVNTLNGAFSLIDKATDKIAMLSDTLVTAVSKAAHKVFNRKNKKGDEDYYE